MTIIASAPVPGSIDQDDTAEVHGIGSVAELAARVAAGPFSRQHKCPPWCAEHVDNTTDPGFGNAAWHRGRKYESARVHTGRVERLDGRRVQVTEPVTVRAEAYEGPTRASDEQPGVYVSGLGKLSLEDAMDLAADLLRAASELVSAEIAAAKGDRR